MYIKVASAIILNHKFQKKKSLFPHDANIDTHASILIVFNPLKDKHVPFMKNEIFFLNHVQKMTTLFEIILFEIDLHATIYETFTEVFLNFISSV